MSEEEIQRQWLLLQKLARQECVEEDYRSKWAELAKTSTQKREALARQNRGSLCGVMR